MTLDATETSRVRREREFHITVMGRTLEHLGVQMYKHRSTAIAELVANAWDAGATEVTIVVPLEKDYDQAASEIVITDNGSGMSDEDVEDAYLVVGRNRRQDASRPSVAGRTPMGRKGIGKLAGFGLAREMRVETWQDNGDTTALELNVSALKQPPGKSREVAIPGVITPGPPPDSPYSSGTRLTLHDLKHKSEIDVAALKEALARRFSRQVRGSMTICVNAEEVPEPNLSFANRVPAGTGWEEETLSDGNKVRYWYGFSKTTLSAQLRGWTIHVRGKTAQAPNFFFDVEATASGQHGTKYFTGVIEADYLDAGNDDDSDLISTDRQEIDWEDITTKPLQEWGDVMTRKALRDRANSKGVDLTNRVFEIPELRTRIERLGSASKEQIEKYLQKLGQADADDERVVELAEQLILVFEYQHFHDQVQRIDEASEASPEQLQALLEHLQEWKVLESRAILEIVNGRLQIVKTYRKLLVDDVPETHREGKENLHDLLAEYPWLINPEWQVLAEEKELTTQLREWGDERIEKRDRRRYDFLALEGDALLVIIEIKRSGYAPVLADVQRLEQYKDVLRRTHPKIRMVFISNGHYDFDAAGWESRADLDLLTWNEIYDRTRKYYEHYQAVLERDVQHTDFTESEREVQRTREVLHSGVHRDPARRAEGLGRQLTQYEMPLQTAMPPDDLPDPSSSEIDSRPGTSG